MSLRLYCVEWKTVYADDETTLVWARSRRHAEDLFMLSENWPLVCQNSGWGLSNIPRKVGCVS